MTVTKVGQWCGVDRRRRDRRSEACSDGEMQMKTVFTAQKAILTTRETAELLKVTPQTIKNYIYAGKLKSVKTPGVRHRIFRSDLEKSGYLKN